MTKKIIIGCAIFKDKIEYLVNKKLIEIDDIIWLSPGFHDDLKRMRIELDNALNIAKKKAHNPEIFILYGSHCMPEMSEWIKDNNLKGLQSKNCIAAMVGEKKLQELEKNRTMVITPSWIRKMWLGADRLEAKVKWSEIDFRINLGRYDKIIVLDTLIDPVSDEELLEAFDLVQVPLEILECPIDYFQALINNLLCNK